MEGIRLVRLSILLYSDLSLIRLAYRDAISGGRLPAPFSWDAKLAKSVADGLWKNGLESLLHLLLPKCLHSDIEPVHHPHLSFNTEELQNILEKIDFSVLIFERDHDLVFSELLDLFRWLVSDVSLALLYVVWH